MKISKFKLIFILGFLTVCINIWAQETNPDKGSGTDQKKEEGVVKSETEPTKSDKEEKNSKKNSEIEEFFSDLEKREIKKPKFLITGSWSTQYRFKTTQGERDHDLDSMLNLDLEHIIPDRLHFSLSSGLTADIGGHQEYHTHPSQDFRDIYDTYDYNTQGRVYHAYMSIENLFDTKSLIQIGRQARFLDLAYYFDGAYGEISPHKMLKFSMFGGMSVYDFKGPREGDWIMGGGAEFSPFETTKIAFNYVHLTEDSRSEGYNDDIYIIEVNQQLFEYLKLSGTYTILGEESKDLDLRAILSLPSIDFQAQAQVHILINPIERVTMNIDPFSRFMYAEQPYQQFSLNLSKGFGDHFNIEAGYSGRKLDHDRDRAAFNREFDRVYLTGTLLDLPLKGLSFSLSGEAWFSEGKGDNDYYGADCEVAYRFSDRLKMSVGTNYTLYKYDYYIGEERTDVYTTFARVQCMISRNLEFKIGYEWETYEDKDLHRLDIKMTLYF